MLDQLMPRLLDVAMSTSGGANNTTAPYITAVEYIVTRTTYLELMVEYPAVCNQLSRYPLLLDELLDPATLCINPLRLMLIIASCANICCG